jgi:hypothetical protein
MRVVAVHSLADLLFDDLHYFSLLSRRRVEQVIDQESLLAYSSEQTRKPLRLQEQIIDRSHHGWI